jgi:hypothetical protein
MITKRTLRIIKDAGIGLSPAEISEWVEALSLAISAGALRLGAQNLQLIDEAATAWVSKAITVLPAQEYTHGDRALPWIDDSAVFATRSASAPHCIRLPVGHPVRANYEDGQIRSVHALRLPGDYSLDVTNSLSRVFPDGVNPDVSAVYAVLFAHEPHWSRRVARAGEILLGGREFTEGIDGMALSWVEGQGIQDFIDFGALGALDAPVFDSIDAASEFSDSTCILVAVSADYRSAFYHSSAQSGEVLSIKVVSGARAADLLCVELDNGVSLCVHDILAVRVCTEGSELFCAYEGDGYSLSDEYGNFILGSRA